MALLTRLRTARTALGLGRSVRPEPCAGVARCPIRGHHHGRQRALGARAAPARGRRPPRRGAGAEAGGAGRGGRGDQGPDGLLVLHRELVAPGGRGRGPDGPLLRADRPRGARAERRAGEIRFIGRCDELDDELRAKIAQAEATTAGNDRLRLFVAMNYGGRQEIARRRAALRGRERARGGRGGVRAPSLRARPARPRAGHPHQRRAAPVELPAVAVRLRRDALLGPPVARLRA